MLSGRFSNCYGIKEFTLTNIDFTRCNKAIIYAPNGVMKTSFSKVFEDIAHGKASTDRIFRDAITSYAITYYASQIKFMWLILLQTNSNSRRKLSERFWRMKQPASKPHYTRKYPPKRFHVWAAHWYLKLDFERFIPKGRCTVKFRLIGVFTRDRAYKQ